MPESNKTVGSVNLDELQKLIISSLSEVQEATHSQDQELIKLNLRVASIELLLQKINATIHEGVNGKEPVLTRISLIEDAVGRLRRREKEGRSGEASGKDSEALALVGVAEAKGKWHLAAIVAPGLLALIANALTWIFKLGGHG